MCTMLGYIHLIVPGENFKLLSGEDDLITYTFNTGTARHFFCRHCGIKFFYIPRSNTDGYSVNVRCLNPFPKNIDITPFDGKNWERHAHKLRHLSQSGKD